MIAFTGLLVGGLLTSCSDRQDNEVQAPVNESGEADLPNRSSPVAAPAPPAESGDEASAGTAVLAAREWAGTYKGKVEGNDARGTLEITPASNNRLDVEFGIGAPGCAGRVAYQDVLPPGGDTWILSQPEGKGEQCRLTLRRSGSSISVDEEDCNAHGFECSFQGTVSR